MTDQTGKDRPELDQHEGSLAASEAAQARRDVLEALRVGEMTLAGLFAAADEERPADGEEHHRILGHVHLRAALLALPHIGEGRADAMLGELNLDGGAHVAQVGKHQREALVEAAAGYEPK